LGLAKKVDKINPPRSSISTYKNDENRTEREHTERVCQVRIGWQQKGQKKKPEVSNLFVSVLGMNM
jgi:hypothetical protein